MFFGSALLLGFAIAIPVANVAQGSFSMTQEFVKNMVAQVRPITFESAQGGPEVIVRDVIESDEDSEKKYIVLNNAKVPKVTARSYIVADIETGDVIISERPKQVYPIASLTKLMTAMVAEELYGNDEDVVVSQTAIDTYGAQGHLKKLENYTVEELLYPLLLESSNDAAEALALIGDRKAFIAGMNGKAKSLGLNLTEYDDASGLSMENTSTVRDLFKLVQYIYKYRSYLFDITQLKSYELRDKTWFSNNRFKNDREYIGGKNGYTDEAHHTHIGLFRLPLDENGGYRDIAIILLRGEASEKDTRAFIKYLKDNVRYVESE